MGPLDVRIIKESYENLKREEEKRYERPCKQPSFVNGAGPGQSGFGTEIVHGPKHVQPVIRDVSMGKGEEG